VQQVNGEAPKESSEALRSSETENENGGGKLDIEIREMSLDDLSSVFALGERIFTPDLWPTLYRTWDEYEVVDLFASDGEFCFVADAEDTVIGFALGTLIEKRKSSWTYGHVVWLGVDPAYQGYGIAKRLLDRLTEALIEEGARMMLVDTDPDNTAAMRFFKREGFGKAVDHVYMSKNLTNTDQYRRRKREARD